MIGIFERRAELRWAFGRGWAPAAALGAGSSFYRYSEVTKAKN